MSHICVVIPHIHHFDSFVAKEKTERNFNFIACFRVVSPLTLVITLSLTHRRHDDLEHFWVSEGKSIGVVTVSRVMVSV